MKVSIIGAGGLVGSCAAFALQCSGIVREIGLIDVNQDAAEGQALDLLHGGPSTADQIIRPGGYEQVSDSDLICITAGLRRKPDESRLDLINRNTDLFMGILDNITSAGIKDSAIIFVVSNPVDILTYLAGKKLGLPPNQVLGLGTQLDTIRFRSLIAAYLGAAPTQTSALILGEHGASMVPIWSSATIGGLPLEKYPCFTPALAQELHDRTKGSVAEVISKKGGAGFAVGIAIRDVIDAIALDKQRIMPVSSLQDGSCYGIHDCSISVPTVIGKGGRVALTEIELWPKEVSAIRRSASVLQETLSGVLQKVSL